jgi:HAD superfamily hydrolase (TIGR01549 family)
MKIRAVFFDFGGTLLVLRRDQIFRRVLSGEGREATTDQIHAAYNKAEPRWLSEYSERMKTPELTDDAYRELDARVYAELFPRDGAEEAARVSRVVRARWPLVEKDVSLELYPDAEPTLTRLSQDGYRLALVSNAPVSTSRTVDRVGLRRFLDPVVISGLVGFAKPNPEIFRIAMRLAGVDPGETVHVGDLYDSDVVGAENAGIKGILLDRDGTQTAVECPRITRLDEVYGYLK